MSQLAIADLAFFEPALCDVKGGAINTLGLTPNLSTSINTSVDTAVLTRYDVQGNAINGFNLNLIGYGGAAGAAAAAASIGGTATTHTFAKNFTLG